MNDEITTLRKTIIEADIAYYNLGETFMSDDAYDKSKDKLAELSPNDPLLRTVGSMVESGVKANHKIPMGSLNKVNTKPDFDKWCGKHDSSEEYIITRKLDGGSVSIEYVDGKLIKAITRGDGIEGQDITANALKFQGLPFVAMNSSGDLFNGTVRCEIILETDLWKMLVPVNEQAEKNPRNMATGIAARSSGFQSNYLKAIAFRGFGSDDQLLGNSESDMLTVLSQYGFDVTTYRLGDSEKIWSEFEVEEASRPLLPYWIDGVVVKINDFTRQTKLGISGNRPKGQLAVKFETEEATAVITSVENNVGHTGAITPVVHFDPTVIAGSTVRKATLNNWKMAKTWNLNIGDTIRFHKAGDIIPEVISIVDRALNGIPILEPVCCPACQGDVGYKILTHGNETARLFCLNPKCEKKHFSKLQNFIGKIGVLELGPTVLQALIDSGLVNTPADFFTLHNHKEVAYELTTKEGRRIGQKTIDTILKNLEAKRKLPIHIFLGSLGIAGLGRREIEKIVTAKPEIFGTIDGWLDDTLITYAKELNIPNKAVKFTDGLQENINLIQTLIENGVEILPLEIKEKPANGKTFCITGTLSQPKKVFKELIESAGHIWSEKVNSNLNYLVLADKNSTSGKAKKAHKLGIDLIDETELNELLKDI